MSKKTFLANLLVVIAGIVFIVFVAFVILMFAISLAGYVFDLKVIHPIWGVK